MVLRRQSETYIYINVLKIVINGKVSSGLLQSYGDGDGDDDDNILIEIRDDGVNS